MRTSKEEHAPVVDGPTSIHLSDYLYSVFNKCLTSDLGKNVSRERHVGARQWTPVVAPESEISSDAGLMAPVVWGPTRVYAKARCCEIIGLAAHEQSSRQR